MTVESSVDQFDDLVGERLWLFGCDLLIWLFTFDVSAEEFARTGRVAELLEQIGIDLAKLVQGAASKLNVTEIGTRMPDLLYLRLPLFWYGNHLHD